MSEQPSLDSLSPELLDMIIDLLDLNSIRSLRLTNTTIASKVSQSSFRTYFLDKNIRIEDENQMADFVKMTQLDWKGNLLRNLTIISSVKPQSRFSPTGPISRRRAGLLARAFSNLERHSPGLATLALTVEDEATYAKSQCASMKVPPLRSHGLAKFLESTAAAWRVVATALGESGLQIHKLDLYGSGRPHHRTAIDQFATVVRSTSLSNCFKDLRHLSLSLAYHAPKKSDTTEAQYPLATSRLSTETACQFLKLCPELQSLDIRWGGTKDDSLSEALSEEAHIFDRIATSNKFPALRELNLRGSRVQEDTLLAFLQQTTSLKNAIMYGVNLQSGTFRAIFDHFSAAALEHLHLDSLWEEGGGIVSFTAVSYQHGPHTLVRCGGRTSGHIIYHCSRARATTHRRLPAREICASFTEWNR